MGRLASNSTSMKPESFSKRSIISVILIKYHFGPGFNVFLSLSLFVFLLFFLKMLKINDFLWLGSRNSSAVAPKDLEFLVWS